MICNVDIKKRNYKNSKRTARRNKFIKNHYSRKIKLLEDKIQKEIAHSNKISRMADLAFDSIENQKNKLILNLSKKDLEFKSFESRINELLENKLDMQKQIDMLKRKAEQFDAIQENLSRIHTKAQLDAEDIINSAKDQSMDIINIADKLTYELNIFKSDIKSIIKDLSIGTHTTEDRLNSILHTVNNLEAKIAKIKLNFYKENNMS